MRTRHIRRLLSITLGLIVLACVWFYFAPTGLGGSTTYVVTNGVSMEPRFHTGDLALVRSQSSYHVGEIVAYHSHVLNTIVLHRIIARSGARYVFKGDNNNFIDFEHPLRNQLIGALWMHVPGLGARLQSIRSPALIGILVALGTLLFTGAALAGNRRRRRRQARGADSGARARVRLPTSFPQPLAGVLALGLLASLPLIALALLAFTRAPTARLPYKVAYRQSGTLSYTADATPGPAYPHDRAVTGDPLFTHVLNTVQLRFAYRFHTAVTHSLTGNASLYATVTSTSGWHTTLPLGRTTYFRGDRAHVNAQLDLSSLLALLRRVQSDTATSGSYTLTISPHVNTSGNLDVLPLHASFSPPVKFSLSALELEPATPPGGAGAGAGASAGGAATGHSSSGDQFAPTSNGAVTGTRYQPLFISFKLVRLSVAAARAIALGGLALLICILLAALALIRPRLRGESATIRSRYGRLIVPVERVWQLPGIPVIDVADMDALASIAEHYDRSILHEAGEHGDAFWVSDESGQFRYAIDAPQLADRSAQPLPEWNVSHSQHALPSWEPREEAVTATWTASHDQDAAAAQAPAPEYAPARALDASVAATRAPDVAPVPQDVRPPADADAPVETYAGAFARFAGL